jgi:hypothetical protein
VDADQFDHWDEAINLCLWIRQTAPRMPILLFSNEVRTDDFGPERLTICDATLRTPLSESRFVEGVIHAVRSRALLLSQRRVTNLDLPDG